MQKDRLLKLILLFVLTYVGLYLAGVIVPEMHDWGLTFDWTKLDYMFFLLPIAGFFFMYFLVEWADNYFKGNHARSFIFPVVFIVLSLIAYYVMLYWYFANFAQLSGRSEVQFDFMKIFLDSAYMYFVLSALGGWLSRIILDKFENE